MVGKILHDPVKAWFITVRLYHRCLQVIGDKDFGRPAQMVQTAGERVEEVIGALGGYAPDYPLRTKMAL